MNSYRLQVYRTREGRYEVNTSRGAAMQSFSDRASVVKYLEKLSYETIRNLRERPVSFTGFQENEEARAFIDSAFRRLCEKLS